MDPTRDPATVALLLRTLDSLEESGNKLFDLAYLCVPLRASACFCVRALSLTRAPCCSQCAQGAHDRGSQA